MFLDEWSCVMLSWLATCCVCFLGSFGMFDKTPLSGLATRTAMWMVAVSLTAAVSESL